MKEFSRVFNRKTFLLLLILCLINTAILILCADPAKEITQTGEELSAYLEHYPEFIDKTVANGEVMSMLNVYKSGFAKDHVKKATECFRELGDIELRYGDNRGMVLLIQYRLTDIFQLAFLFMVVMSLFAERKKGLVYIIRSTKHGRGTLFLQRLAVLACATVLGGTLLYASAFFGIHLTFGTDDLSRSIQSLPEFMKCPFRLTIGEYLLASWGVKLLGSLLAAVLLYVILGIFSKLTAYVLVAVFLLGETAAALFIEPISAWNILRYLNLITVVQADGYFSDCIFLNLFGKAAPGLISCVLLMVFLLLALTVAGYFIHGTLYVTQKRSLDKLLERLQSFIERHALQRSLLGWETYKLCLKQGAILLLLGLTLLQVHLSFRYNYYYAVDGKERLSFIKYHGELTQEVLDSAEHEMVLLKDAAVLLEETIEKIENKQPFNAMYYNMVKEKLDENLANQRALQVVLNDMRDGMEYTKRTGRTIYTIQPYTYDLLLNRDQQVKQRAAFLELMVIIVAMAGVYAFEQQNHMRQIIRTSYRGRWLNRVIKPVVAMGFCAVTAIAMHAVQMVHIGITMEFNDLNVPIQSLTFMREFPFYLSIGGYLACMFGLRVLVAMALGGVVLVLSRICADKFTALGLGTFICMLLLSLSGLIQELHFLNPIYLLSADFFR